MLILKKGNIFLKKLQINYEQKKKTCNKDIYSNYRHENSVLYDIHITTISIFLRGPYFNSIPWISNPRK
jgi:hypothetical protein